MTNSTPAEFARATTTWAILSGLLLIVLGFIAIAFPLFAAAAINGILSWLLMLAGVIHILLAFKAHGAGHVIWKLLVGVAYLCFGIFLLLYPAIGITSLTLLIATLFLIEGVFTIILYFRMRAMGGSIWTLVDGIITLILGLMIYEHWPSSSVWAIGTLVGVSLISSGVTRLMLSMAARSAVSRLAS